jgi:hypothetical protein
MEVEIKCSEQKVFSFAYLENATALSHNAKGAAAESALLLY